LSIWVNLQEKNPQGVSLASPEPKLKSMSKSMSKSKSTSKPTAKPTAKPGPKAKATPKNHDGEGEKDKPTRLGDARARMYRDLVFESAECIFGQKGFEHATMQEIAHEAGVSLKTLYASYSGKQDLYEDIQRVRGKAFIEGVMVAAAMGHTPLEKLALTVRGHVDFLFSHRDWLRFRLRTRASWGIRPDDEVAAHYWELGLQNIGDLLLDGMKEGTFYKGDPVSVSTIAQAIMQVAVTAAVEADETDVVRTSDDIMLQLTRLLCITPNSGTNSGTPPRRKKS
jgi:AcrR family transcriptional regulator